MDERFRRSAIVGAIARKVAAAQKLSPTELLLVAASWSMIGAASLIIAVTPSRRILQTLGQNLGPVTHAPASNARQQRRARQIARVIGIAARNAPFRSDCYPRALAAAQLCRWFGIPHAVHLGARFAAPGSARAGGLEAHAWVCSGAVTLCGGQPSAEHFGTVACFVHAPRSGRRHAVD